MANKPSIEFRVGGCKIAVWAEEKQDESGRTYMQYTYTLVKSFKRKGSDKYEDQKITLFGDDLWRVQALCAEAIKFGEVTSRVPQDK